MSPVKLASQRNRLLRQGPHRMRLALVDTIKHVTNEPVKVGSCEN